jgi:hypothetical protein
MIERRSFLRAGIGFIACAPAIVRASSLMAVKPWMHDQIVTVNVTILTSPAVYDLEKALKVALFAEINGE